MSDSDEDLTENNMFRNENTFLRGQGPFMTNKFKRIASSTYSHPISSQNFMNGYQRSIYHKKETSPMSMQSVPDFSRHNFDGSYYGRGISCQRSVMTGRSQSPASLGSMDSTTSAAYVAQIFKNMKFNKYDKRIINEAYNKYFRNRARRRIGKRRKLKLFLKHNRRKSGDDSGDDGSNSSISSDDNRSVRSAIPRESILRPSNRVNRTEILHFRATMKDSDMYKDCTENLKHSTLKNMFNGHNSVMDTIPEKVNSTVIGIQRENNCNSLTKIVQEKVTNGSVGTQRERFTKGFVLPSQRFNKSIIKPIANMPLNTEVCLLPDRNHANNSDSENEEIFSNRTLRENTECRKRTLENNDIICPDEKRNKLSPKTSNNMLRDDITFKKPQMPLRRQMKAKPNFLSEPVKSKLSQPMATSVGQASCLSQSLYQDKSILQPHRKFNGFLNIRNTVHTKADNSKQVNTDSDNDEIFTTNTTESNILKSNSTQQKLMVSNGTDNRNNNDYQIVSPAKIKPKKVKKNIPKKDCHELPKQMQDKDKPTEEANKEILISKSLQPLVGNVENITTIPRNISQAKQVNTEDGNELNNSEKPLSISEVSMKPSFIKRKLFTQKLDMAEEKNMSNDNSVNSPQTRNYKSREKNKVRKLATSQSCLSRDVIGEENILDLIHKIVPADKINMTAASNQRTRKSNPENEDNWDVASVISMCNNTNESDTFTDEEIFQLSKAHSKNKNKVNVKTTKANELQNCEVVLEKVSVDCNKPGGIPDVKNTNCAIKRTVASCVRSFWDTDFETDVEDNIRTPLKTHANRLGQIKEVENVTHQENIPKSKNTTVANITNRINTSIRKFTSQASEKKSSNNCKAIENTSNKFINDKDIQVNHKTAPSRGAPKNIGTKYDLKTFLESKELISDSKIDSKKSEKKETNNSRPKNDLKPLETKTLTKNATKNNSKPSNKNKVMKPTTGNTKLVHKENEAETKPQRKRPQKVKVGKSILNGTFNSSTDENSILRRSLRLDSKQQLFGISLNSTDDDSKSIPKPISKAKTKNTPKRNTPKKSLGFDKKQTAISATKKSTPSRRDKKKKIEMVKLNESSKSTRNRSLNISLKVKQQRNHKQAK